MTKDPDPARSDFNSFKNAVGTSGNKVRDGNGSSSGGK